jgi:hypothetical protein
MSAANRADPDRARPDLPRMIWGRPLLHETCVVRHPPAGLEGAGAGLAHTYHARKTVMPLIMARCWHLAIICSIPLNSPYQKCPRCVRQAALQLLNCRCGGLNPDPSGLKAVSEATGVHIVMGCGHYVEEYQPAINGTRDMDDFAGEMIAQVSAGGLGDRHQSGPDR